jgi:hypothetical protein
MTTVNTLEAQHARREERKLHGTHRWRTETERLNDLARNLGIPFPILWSIETGFYFELTATLLITIGRRGTFAEDSLRFLTTTVPGQDYLASLMRIRQRYCLRRKQ